MKMDELKFSPGTAGAILLCLREARSGDIVPLIDGPLTRHVASWSGLAGIELHAGARGAFDPYTGGKAVGSTAEAFTTAIVAYFQGGDYRTTVHRRGSRVVLSVVVYRPVRAMKVLRRGGRVRRGRRVRRVSRTGSSPGDAPSSDEAGVGVFARSGS
jgi:hypothetical protein